MVVRGIRTTALAALVMLAIPAAVPQVLLSPTGDSIVLTDPVVRTTQLGYMPVGSLVAWRAGTGLGVAVLPAAGQRWVQLIGQPVATASGPVAAAIDLVTGVQLLVRLPPVREPLVSATVLRATTNGVTVRRRGATSNEAEILPYERILVLRGGAAVPASEIGARLAPGSSVLIPVAGGPRGAIRVQAAARRAATTRASRTGRRAATRTTSARR